MSLKLFLSQWRSPAWPAGLLMAALTVSCGGPSDDAPVEDTAQAEKGGSQGVPAAPAPSSFSLLPLPSPDISRLEEGLQEQIREAQSRLEAVRSGDGPLEQALAFGELAMLYQASDLLEAAEISYQNAETLDPQNDRWPYYLGHIYKSQGRPAETVESFRRALERMPPQGNTGQEAAALYWLGEVHLDQDDLEQAEPLFSRALERDPNSAAALAGLGQVASARGDGAAAIGHFQEALALVPEATGMHYRLGMEYRKLGQMDQARRHLSQVQGQSGIRARLVPSDPLLKALEDLTSSARLLTRQANLTFQAGRFEEAAQLYRKALAADPEDPVALSNLGSTLARLGDRSGAIQQYQEVLRLHPENSTADYGLGVLYAQEGRDEPAVHHYQSVVKLDPRNRQALFNLANAFSRLRRHQEALSHYGRVIQLDPGNRMARIGQAMTLIQTGRCRRALAGLEEALQVLPGNLQIKHILARLLAACPEESILNGNRSLALAQQVFEAEATLEHTETLAMAYAQTGQFQEAIGWQVKALEAAEAAQRPELVTRIEKNLALYQQEKPCRTPWPPDHQFASPVR